jgi:hypothetical protein
VRLLCLVLDYRTGELVVRCLYRSQDVAGPNTQARRRNGERLRSSPAKASAPP